MSLFQPDLSMPTGICPLCGIRPCQVAVLDPGDALGGVNTAYVRAECCEQCCTERGDWQAFHDVIRVQGESY